MNKKDHKRGPKFEEFAALYREAPPHVQKVLLRAIHALSDEKRNKVRGTPFSKAFLKLPPGDVQAMAVLMDRMRIPKSFLEARCC